MLWLYIGSPLITDMWWPRAPTLHGQTKRHETEIFNNHYRLHVHMLLMHVDSHGVKNRAGKILAAEAGQDVDGHGRQEGQQFDLKPECDKARVV